MEEGLTLAPEEALTSEVNEPCLERGTVEIGEDRRKIPNVWGLLLHNLKDEPRFPLL